MGNGGVNSSCSKYFCTSSSVVLAPKYSVAGDCYLGFGRWRIKWIYGESRWDAWPPAYILWSVFSSTHLLREGSCLGVPGGQRLAVFMFRSRLILPRHCREPLSAKRQAGLGSGAPMSPSRTSFFLCWAASDPFKTGTDVCMVQYLMLGTPSSWQVG